MRYLILLLLVSCGVNGSNGVSIQGPAGRDGVHGVNGMNTVFTQIPATLDQCEAGGTVLLMALDSERTGNYSPMDVNQQSLIICNGVQGSTGAQGIAGSTGATGATGATSPFSPMVPISPCGAASSPYKEVLLCLADGSVLSSFSATMAGADTRLAFLTAGTFTDTDESNCTFNVTINNNETTIEWDAGSNQYATWNAQTVICAKQI